MFLAVVFLKSEHVRRHVSPAPPSPLLTFLELVSRVLIRYLGDYIEGLDKQQLQISIFGGNVELQNLSLKTSALNKLNLPILVKAGALPSEIN